MVLKDATSDLLMAVIKAFAIGNSLEIGEIYFLPQFMPIEEQEDETGEKYMKWFTKIPYDTVDYAETYFLANYSKYAHSLLTDKDGNTHEYKVSTIPILDLKRQVWAFGMTPWMYLNFTDIATKTTHMESFLLSISYEEVMQGIYNSLKKLGILRIFKKNIVMENRRRKPTSPMDAFQLTTIGFTRQRKNMLERIVIQDNIKLIADNIVKV